jgi:hypothetical protein
VRNPFFHRPERSPIGGPIEIVQDDEGRSSGDGEAIVCGLMEGLGVGAGQLIDGACIDPPVSTDQSEASGLNF